IISAVLLAPAPFDDADRLVALGEAPRGDPDAFEPVSYSNFRDWEDGAADILAMAALRASRVRIGEGEATDREDAAFVTPDLLPLLGIRPLAGRGFAVGDDRQGEAPVAMLS